MGQVFSVVGQNFEASLQAGQHPVQRNAQLTQFRRRMGLVKTRVKTIDGDPARLVRDPVHRSQRPPHQRIAQDHRGQGAQSNRTNDGAAIAAQQTHHIIERPAEDERHHLAVAQACLGGDSAHRCAGFGAPLLQIGVPRRRALGDRCQRDHRQA